MLTLNFHCAAKIIAGIELMHMIRKGQYAGSEGQVMSAAELFYSLASEHPRSSRPQTGRSPLLRQSRPIHLWTSTATDIRPSHK